MTAWAPTTIIRPADLVEVVSDLRARPGADLYVYGSLTVARALMAAALVDELVLFVEPVTLGGGKSLFPTDGEAREWELTSVEPTATGGARLPVSASGGDGRRLGRLGHRPGVARASVATGPRGAVAVGGERQDAGVGRTARRLERGGRRVAPSHATAGQRLGARDAEVALHQLRPRSPGASRGRAGSTSGRPSRP